MSSKIDIEFGLEVFLVEKHTDKDEDGYVYDYWDILDTETLEIFYVRVDEEDEEDEEKIKQLALSYMVKQGYLTEALKEFEVKGDIIQYEIYSYEGCPLYRLTLR